MSNMRGLDTQVRAIRRRVFKEVAKLGFEANSETLLEDMEAIPYEIVNDDTVKYRESTYRSRAIVRERLRLAMGLSLRPENVRQSVRMMRSRKKSAHVKMPVVWERLFLTNTAVPILTQKNVCPAECVW